MCAMYGHCNNFTFDGVHFPPIDCPTPGPAQLPSFNLTECPHLQHSYVCCDSEQYREFADGFVYLESFLSTCRACIENFRTYLCATTCGSLQSAYMSVRETEMVQRLDVHGSPIKGENTTVVDVTNVNVSLAVAEALWDSCKGIKNPSTGLSALAFIAEGAVDAQSFMALVISGSMTPVKNVFNYVDDDNTALTLHNIGRDMYSCANTTSGYSCSCNDCPQGCNRCPAPTHYNDSSLVPDGVWPAFGHNYLDPVGYGMAVGFLCYVAVVLLAGLCGQWVSGGRLLLAQSSAQARRMLWWSGVCVLAVLLVYVVSLLWMWLAQQVTVTRGDESGLVNVLSSWLHPAYFAFLLGSFIALILAVYFFLWRYMRAYPYSFQYQPLHDSHSHTASGDDAGDDDDVDKPTLLSRYATIVASYPWLVIAGGLLLTAVCALGLMKAQLQSDPIALWVSPSSQVLKDKQYFDATFGPFYRTEQLIFTPVTAPTASPASNSTSPVLTRQTMLMLQQLTDTIRALTVSHNGSDVSLSTLCYRPIPGQDCVVESVLEYFARTNATIYSDPAPPLSDVATTDAIVRSWVSNCTNQYIATSCRGSIGAPTFPWVVLGGYDANDYETATALIVTFPLNNAPEQADKAKAWEARLLQLLASDDVQTMAQQAGLEMAFMTERSVEDEITRGTYKDVDIVLLSYALMLLYISCALSSGHWGRPASTSASTASSRCTFPIHTKFLLGVSALVIVICSLVVSVGVVSVLGLSVTPIISEVIPFLVLAIGIDNVFLLSQSFARTSATLPAATRLAMALHEVGTGIALAAASECGAFLLGASTDIPAVQVFAVMSAVAIGVGWLLQMTVFCAVLVLDSKRMEQGRWDVLFCVQDRQVEDDVEQWKAEHDELAAQPQPHLQQQQSGRPADPTAAAAVKPKSSPFAAESYLQQFFRRFYLPFLFHPVVRVAVVLLFPLVFFFLLSYGFSHLQLGLDQSTVVPNDSYLQAYFAAESQYLNVGPPVYFVIRNSSDSPSNSSVPSTYNYSDYAFQDRVCSMSGSVDNSVEGLISAAACTPGSYIAQSPSSWMDAYMVWLGSTQSVDTPVCCAYDPEHPDQLCQMDEVFHEFDFNCVPCVAPTELVYAPQRPPPAAFERWMQLWLTNSTCDESCAFCSAGLYDDVAFTTTSVPHSNVSMAHVYASRYMTYHTPLRNQSDFIAAIRSAHELSDRISAQQQLDVYPYSIVYVYFQQYLDIEHVAVLNIGLAFVAIFVLSLLLLRCVWIAVLQTLTIAMIVGDLIGGMAAWGVYLNALSVLNIIMGVGISVEFCIHVSTRFLFTAHGSRTQRAAHAMYTVGVSVVEGITLTKVTGVAVLAAASSQVFAIYYFRMYLLIVLLGVAHGCVWLPVVLSLVGSRPQTKRAGLCGGWTWGWPWQASEADVWQQEGEDEQAEESEDWEADAEVAELESSKRKVQRLSASVDEKERALLDEENSVRREIRKSRHR